MFEATPTESGMLPQQAQDSIIPCATAEEASSSDRPSSKAALSDYTQPDRDRHDMEAKSWLNDLATTLGGKEAS